MIGLAGWTLERQPINDATLPILADGIKWLGYVPKAKILWNLGFYGDAVSEGQTFSTYENQISGRSHGCRFSQPTAEICCTSV
jgi:phosphate-selective porin OprO/OprP